MGRYGVGEVEEEEERSVGMCVRVGRWVGISRFCPRQESWAPPLGKNTEVGCHFLL